MSKKKLSDSEIEKKIMKVDVKQTILIGFGFLTAMLAWTFYNFKIPIILNGISGLTSGTWNRVGRLGTEPIMEVVGGAIMVLDNIIAIIIQPYFGKLSDRLESKYGRRSPFIIIGLPTAVFCLVILPFMPLIGTFIAVILVFNLAMAFYRAPIMSLLPDKTPPQALSTANSYVSLMGGLGFVLGMVVPIIVGFIPGADPLMTGNYETQNFFWQDFWGFILVGIIMFLCLVIFLWKVKETPTGDKFFRISKRQIKFDVYTQKIIPYEEGEAAKAEEGSKFFEEWKEIFGDEDKSALWVLIAVFFYLFGFNAIEFSFGRFATSYLQVTEGMASLILALMPVMLIVFAILAGSLATKYGRLKIMKIGLMIMASCTVVIIIMLISLRQLVFVRPLTIIDLLPLIIPLSIAGIGYGFTHINALPVVWQLAPKDKLGAYTGVYYMVSQLGEILSPLFIGIVYFIIRAFGGDQWVALFPYFLIGVIIGFLCLLKVKKGDAEPLTDEDLARLRAQFAAGD